MTVITTVLIFENMIIEIIQLLVNVEIIVYNIRVVSDILVIIAIKDAVKNV